MKTAIDKNESSFAKMKRESLEWLEKNGKTAPPFIALTVNLSHEPQEQENHQISCSAKIDLSKDNIEIFLNGSNININEYPYNQLLLRKQEQPVQSAEDELDSIISEYDDGNMTLPTLKSKIFSLFIASQKQPQLSANWERDFIEWDNSTHSNASQKDIINWFKSHLKPGYPELFVTWCIIVPVFTDDGITVQPITSEVFKTIAELFTYWKEQINSCCGLQNSENCNTCDKIR